MTKRASRTVAPSGDSSSSRRPVADCSSDAVAAHNGSDDETAGAPLSTIIEGAVEDTAEVQGDNLTDHNSGPAERQGARLRPRLLTVLIVMVGMLIGVLIIGGGMV